MTIKIFLLFMGYAEQWRSVFDYKQKWLSVKVFDYRVSLNPTIILIIPGREAS